MKFNEIYTNKIKGDLQLQLIKDNKIINEYNEHNLIVNNASKIMASIIVPEGIPRVAIGTEGQKYDGDVLIGYEYSGTYDLNNTYPIKGINYVAFGNGLIETFPTEAQKGEYILIADELIKPSEQEQFTTLQHEIYRTKFSHWAFINSIGEISSTPTNQVRFTAVVEYEDFMNSVGGDSSNAYIIEMALFANAEDTKNSGEMFNYKLFKGWKMIEESSLLVHWTISF